MLQWNRVIPASLSRKACSRVINPREQHTSICSSLRILFTTWMISSNSPALSWSRPLVTREKRTAPASLAFLAISIICSSGSRRYTLAPVFQKPDCAQNRQFSGQWPLRALTMAQKSIPFPLNFCRILSAIARRTIVSASEVWISSIASVLVISCPSITLSTSSIMRLQDNSILVSSFL